MVDAVGSQGGGGAAADGAADGTGGDVRDEVPLLGPPNGICVEPGVVDNDVCLGGGWAVAAAIVADRRAGG